jgi:hypothetical protein
MSSRTGQNLTSLDLPNHSLSTEARSRLDLVGRSQAVASRRFNNPAAFHGIFIATTDMRQCIDPWAFELSASIMFN